MACPTGELLQTDDGGLFGVYQTWTLQRDMLSTSIVYSKLSVLIRHCVFTTLREETCQSQASTKADAPSMPVQQEVRSIESAEIRVSSTTTMKAKFARQIRAFKKTTVEELPSTEPYTPDILERRFLLSVPKTGC